MPPPLDQSNLSHNAFQALPMPIAIIDHHGVIIHVNHAWRQAMTEAGDWETSSPIGVPYLSICEQAAGPHPDIHESLTLGIRHVLEGRLNQFIRTYSVRQNNEDRPHQVAIKALEGYGAVIVHQDLGPSTASGRHRALRAKEREETLPRLAEHAPVLMWTCDANGQSQWYNKRWLDFCGVTMEEALANDWIGRVHPDDLAQVVATITEERRQRREYLHKFRLRRADGEYRWLQERCQPLSHHDGKFAGFIGSCSDITDIVRTEQELANHRDYLHRQLHFAGSLNRMSQAIIGLDENDQVLVPLLDMMGRALGIDANVVIEVRLHERNTNMIGEWSSTSTIKNSPHHSFDIKKFSESLRHAWEMRSPLESHSDQINPRFSSEGSAQLLHEQLAIISLLWLPFSFRADGFMLLGVHQINRRRIWLADEREYMASVANLIDLALQKSRMLSERRAGTKHLLHVSKMEAMGRLAGGIAHEFNNLLTAINGHSSLLQRGLPPGHPLRTHADTIIRAADRAAETTRHLLSFSRQQPIAPVALDPNRLIERMRMLIDRMIPENITIQTDLIANIGQVLGDPGQLELAMMNLAINARDAMPNGGILTILSREEFVDDLMASRSGIIPGLYITLSVRDSGIGLDGTTKERLFEPFFSANDVSQTDVKQTTGLGLSSAYGAVRSMNGYIGVNSDSGKGTTLTIYLPKIVKDTHQLPTPLRLGALGGNETVLLVEDNITVLEITRDALRKKGYHVLVATDGNEAVRLAQEHAASIDLLLTDLVLPGLSGENIAIRLRAKHPSLKVVISSGYSANAFALNRNFIHDGFLAKPYTLDELMRTVRKALERRV
jgi:PAS domain S-box-containing protein